MVSTKLRSIPVVSDSSRLTTEGAMASEMGSLASSVAPSATLVTFDNSSRDASRSRRRSSMRSSSRLSCSSRTRSTPPSYAEGSSIRPTSYPCGWPIPASGTQVSHLGGGTRHDGTAQPRLQGTIGWALLGEREAPAFRWARDTAVRGGPGRTRPGPPLRQPGPGAHPLSEAELPGTGGARRPQELGAPVHLLDLADLLGRAGQRGEGAQEAAVGPVLPRDRALSSPARATQGVEAAVVAGAGVRVRRDVVLVGQGILGEHGPGQAGCRVGGGHLLGSHPLVQC